MKYNFIIDVIIGICTSEEPSGRMIMVTCLTCSRPSIEIMMQL